MRHILPFLLGVSLLFFSSNVFGQCPDPPVWDPGLIPNITLSTSVYGYCPNTNAVVDIADSGDPEANGAVSDGSGGNPDCDISNLISPYPFSDVWDQSDCDEIIERTWQAEYNDVTGVFETYVQEITLVDDVVPDLICPDDIQVMDACDEDDPNITQETGFPYNTTETLQSLSLFNSGGISGIGGTVTDDCDPAFDFGEIYYSDGPVTLFDGNCPGPLGEFTRTWRVVDRCGNEESCDQLIELFDTQIPVIDVGPPTVMINVDAGEDCDENNVNIEPQTGFAYSSSTVDGIDIADFPGVTSDNCGGGMAFTVEYTDSGVNTLDPCTKEFVRTWIAYDQCGNASDPVDQMIQLVDIAGPEFPQGPGFFYDQDSANPNGPFVYESLNCPIAVTWTPPNPGDFFDNCTADGDILVQSDFNPGDMFDEGINTVTYTFRDDCGLLTQVSFDIDITCLACGGSGSLFTDCDAPPVECDLNIINNFSSCTPDYVLGSGSSGPLCNNGGLHNPSYFNFIAGSETVDITVIPSGCAPGDNGDLGVQANVTDPCNASMCYGDSGSSCFTTTFSFTASGLTIGNEYQLVVDGCNGSTCLWDINIDSAPPFELPDPEDPDVVLDAFTSCSLDPNALVICPNADITFFPENLELAEFFFCWSIDNSSGVTAVNEDTNCQTAEGGGSYSCPNDYTTCGPLTLNFTQEGTYQVCLAEMDNGCDNLQLNYCYDVIVQIRQDEDFGSVDVCEVNMPWEPDINGLAGEEWLDTDALDEGMYTIEHTDDCGCMFNQMIEINTLEMGDPGITDVEVCIDDLDSWDDPNLGIDWNDIQSYLNPAGDVAEVNPLPGGSFQTQYDGDQCDTIVTYNFFIYEAPGVINEATGSACDAVLSFDLDEVNFPPFMFEEDFIYEWYFGTTLIDDEPSVSVTDPGMYSLNIGYQLPSGATCTFVYELDVTIDGTAPTQPTFISAPTETCVNMLTGLVYSVPAASGATYTWSVVNGSIASNNGDNIVVDVVDPALPMMVEVYASTTGCGDSPPASVTLNVTPAPEISLGMLDPICVGQTTTIMSTLTAGVANQYFWTVDDATATWSQTGSSTMPSIDVSWATAGLQTFSLYVEDAGGCESAIVNGSVMVMDVLPPPTFTCSSTSNSVTITLVDAAGGSGSTVNITSGQTATMTGPNEWTVDGLTAGQMINFEAITLGGTHPCGNSAPLVDMCETVDCTLNPMLTATMNEICLDGTEAPFNINETSGATGGTWSGPGIDNFGVFDPAAAMAGSHVITYEVTDVTADCTADATVTINVYEDPDEAFMPSLDTVCLNEVLNIDFLNTPGFSYTWDFDSDSSNPATTATGFPVSWSTDGDKIISMTVTNGSCETIVQIPVHVRPALVLQPILCGTLLPNSVELIITPIPGVVEYIVESSINSVPQPTVTQAGTLITITPLNEGDIVDVSVTAVDPNGCFSPVNVGQCEAQNCTAFDVDITASETVACWDPVNGVTIGLTQVVTDPSGAPAIGDGMWIGQDIDAAGMFTPSGPGLYTLSYSFTETGTNCPGSNSVDINILDAPTSEFFTDLSSLCVGETITLEIDGVYDAGIDYGWTSSADPSDYDLVDNGDGTFSVVFVGGQGTIDFTLQTTVGSCSSVETTESFDLVAPLDFTLTSLVECYTIDDVINLEALDAAGDPVAGTWSGEDVSVTGIFIPLTSDTTYTLTFEEANCGVTEDVSVELVARPNLAIDVIDQVICITDEAEVTITTDFFDEISHVGDPPLSGLAPNFTMSFPSAGDYTYTSIIDRPGDCDSEEITWSVTVEDVPDLPVITCESTVNSITFTWTEPDCASGYTLLVDDQPMSPTTPNSVTIENLDEGQSVDVSISVDSDCACDFDGSVSESCTAKSCEDATITFANTIETSYCLSDLPAPFQLTADVTGDEINNTGSYSWTGDGIDGDGNVDMSSLTPGAQSIMVVYEEGGCTYEETFNFEIFSIPEVDYEIVDAPCPEISEGMIDINVLSGGTVVIDAGGNTLSEGMNSILAGAYTLQVTDENNCVYEENIIVGQAAAPNTTFNVPNFIFTDSSTVFTYDVTVANLETMTWSVNDEIIQSFDCTTQDCGDLTFTPTEEGEYEVCVMITYGNGCEITECRTFDSEELRIFSTYLPNIIVPGDGTNPDNSTMNLYIEGFDLVVRDIAIYDRWGSRVYNDSADYPGGDNEVIYIWDGTFEGGSQFIPGVYVYVIEVFYEDGAYTEFLTGDVTVLR